MDTQTLAWLLTAFASEAIQVPPDFSRWLATGEQVFCEWYLLGERGAAANRSNLENLYPSRAVLPFARRRDRDDVACLVLRDGDFPRGSVMIVHDGAMPGYEVEAEVASVSQWFEQACEECGFGTKAGSI